MIIIGIALIVASFVAFTVAAGVVVLPDSIVRERLLARGAPVEPEATGRRMRQVDRLEGTERYVMPSGMFRRIERNLVLAGHPAAWTTRKIAIAKVVLPLAVGAMALMLVTGDSGTLVKALAVGGVVVAYFVPDLLISSRAKERQAQIQRDLPDVLDKIVISIDAGLGFEAAMSKISRSGTGPLAEELVRTGQDVALGMARRDAYEALQRRTSAEDLTSFIRGVIQAEEHGSSMSSMVRIQSKEMRLKRKLRAEGKAGKVSVKLLAPLMACIFPVLFVVVLAPGVISAIAMM